MTPPPPPPQNPTWLTEDLSLLPSESWSTCCPPGSAAHCAGGPAQILQPGTRDDTILLCSFLCQRHLTFYDGYYYTFQNQCWGLFLLRRYSFLTMLVSIYNEFSFFVIF